MATKTKRDSFTFIYAAYGNPTRRTETDTESVTAVFSRKRPAILTPTSMTVQRVKYNRGSYPVDPWTGHVPLPTGATSSTQVRRGHAGKGDRQAALLLASSNLTAQSMELGETIGSFSETFRMVAKRLRQVAQFARHLRAGRFDLIAAEFKGEVPGSVRRLPASKRLSEGYLEVQFGWLPAISDVYSAMDAFHSRVTKGQRVTSRGFVGGDAVEVIGIDGKSTRVVSGATVRLSATVSNPALRTLNQLGLANPALVAWQLTPFSFVVDWFLPISHILGYYSSHIGLSNVTACEYTVSRVLTMYAKRGVPLTAWSDIRTVIRDPVPTSVVWPDLTWRGFNSSLGKVLTATALVRQNFR